MDESIDDQGTFEQYVANIYRGFYASLGCTVPERVIREAAASVSACAGPPVQ